MPRINPAKVRTKKLKSGKTRVRYMGEVQDTSETYARALKRFVNEGVLTEENALNSLRNYSKGDRRFQATKDSFFSIIRHRFDITEEYIDGLEHLERLVTDSDFDMYYHNKGFTFNEVFNYKDRDADPSKYTRDYDEDKFFEVLEDLGRFVSDSRYEEVLNSLREEG